MSRLQVNTANESLEQVQRFERGDYVLLTTIDIDTARGVRTGERRKYVGPFRILEERASEDTSYYYKVELPKCLGLSEHYFESSKVVLFQKCEDSPGKDEHSLDKVAETPVPVREELGGGQVCKRRKEGAVDGDGVAEREAIETKGFQIAEKEVIKTSEVCVAEKEFIETKEDGEGRCVTMKQVTGNEELRTTEKTEQDGIHATGESSHELTKVNEPSVTVKAEPPESTSKQTVSPRRTPLRRTCRKRESKEISDEKHELKSAGPSTTEKVTPDNNKADSPRLINSILKTNEMLHDEESPAAEDTSAPAPEVHIIDGEVEYEVEKILADRRVEYNAGYHRVEYLVKWKGYPESEATWEPRANLTHVHRILREYTRNKKKNGRK